MFADNLEDFWLVRWSTAAYFLFTAGQILNILVNKSGYVGWICMLHFFNLYVSFGTTLDYNCSTKCLFLSIGTYLFSKVVCWWLLL